ncbi:DUF6168 family protein [uncultured Winogradskyella sp.]|mgnify:CR=1 FL=1|uniref:DUF6168 family protein n=1 Tax=uncultured Winogradskyella sp. TaxID=395353 RepID=UPI003512CCA5
MRTKLLVVLILFVVILALLFVLQPYVLPQQDLRLDFPTTNIFIFNVVFTLILLLLLTYIAQKETVKDNLGFLYLASVLVKPIVFIVVFRGLFFNEKPITQMEAIVMLLPILISLFFEVFYCSILLKAQASKKKTSKD